MKKRPWLAVLFLLSAFNASAESLWDDGFDGYLTGLPNLSLNQLVTVYLNTETKLSFSATGGGDREMVLEFTGGETGDLFSFLPEVKSNTSVSREGEEELTLQASLTARIQEINDAGLVYIQGSRSMTIQGAVQAVTVTGWLNPADLDSDNAVSFSRLAESTLVFRTFTEADKPLLSEEDIAEVLAQPAAEVIAVDEGTAETETAAGNGTEEGAGTNEPAADTAGETPAPAAAKTSLTISEDKKREILLDYINQMVDLIFQ